MDTTAKTLTHGNNIKDHTTAVLADLRGQIEAMQNAIANVERLSNSGSITYETLVRTSERFCSQAMTETIAAAAKKFAPEHDIFSRFDG